MAAFFEEEISRQQPKMTINNQQVSATAAVLSEGSNIMADGSAEGIAFSCLLGSVTE